MTGRDKREKALEIKGDHEDWLLKIDDVTGVGLGQDAGGAYVIKVYVSRLSPELQQRIPHRFGGLKVEIETIGEVSAF